MTINLLELALVIWLAALCLAWLLVRINATPSACTGNCNQGRDCDCTEVHP